MQLSFAQLESIATGAVSVIEEPMGVRFYRFTREQFTLYENRNEKFFQKSKTPSGIKLCFRTDSTSLYLRFLVEGHIGASFMAFDVFVDGEMIGSLNNFEGVQFPRNYLKTEFPIGEFSGSFQLGEGEKTVTVHLPWNGYPYLQELSLDDGATLIPVKPDKKLLALGDSITYGNAAMHPSDRYVARLCEALGAEEWNKGIGGEFFFPELATTRETFQPDYILVAYGTNDWRKHPRDVFFSDVKAFFENLEKTYPNIPKIVVTPIWRKNHDAQTDFSSMDEVREGIRLAAQVCTGVTIVDGLGLVPQDVEYFGDYGCHPNGRGFECFFQNLWAQIKRD